MTGRATSPEPAIAPSTHLLPVALNALANSATAAASPPDVHQWVTSSSTPAGLLASAVADPADPGLAASADPVLAGSVVLPSPPLSPVFLHPCAVMMTTTTVINAIVVRLFIRLPPRNLNVTGCRQLHKHSAS